MRPITQQIPLKHRPRPHCALSNLFCIWLPLPSIQKGNFSPFLFFSSPPPLISIPLHTYTDTHTPPSTTELGVIILNLQEMKLKNESQSREGNWVKYDDDTQEATWQNQKYTLRTHPHPPPSTPILENLSHSLTQVYQAKGSAPWLASHPSASR